MCSIVVQLLRTKHSDSTTTQELPGWFRKSQELSGTLKNSQEEPGNVKKHEKSSTKGQAASWNIRNCQEASVLEAVLHCLSWTAHCPQSSTPCQQTFPCGTVCLVWLALWARDISLMVKPTRNYTHSWTICKHNFKKLELFPNYFLIWFLTKQKEKFKGIFKIKKIKNA